MVSDQFMSQHTFRALADPTRRDILMMLRGGDMTIAEIVANFDMTRAAVKKHLTILTEAGLISSRPIGREVHNSFAPEGMAPVMDWLGAFALIPSVMTHSQT
jgi:DNA-binding transcriptional ArsR family regulator